MHTILLCMLLFFCSQQSDIVSGFPLIMLRFVLPAFFMGSDSNVTVELRKTGGVISERTVGTYMRQMGIRAQWSKPWTITTKDSNFSTELQNILDEQFNPDRPNAVWCSDITYIWTIDGFVYLTSIMDLFSRKIIAWTLSLNLDIGPQNGSFFFSV